MAAGRVFFEEAMSKAFAEGPNNCGVTSGPLRLTQRLVASLYLEKTPNTFLDQRMGFVMSAWG